MISAAMGTPQHYVTLLNPDDVAEMKEEAEEDGDDWSPGVCFLVSD